MKNQALRSFLAVLLGVAVFAADEPKEGARHPIETDASREPRLSTGGDVLIRNVTIHSAIEPAYVGDVLVRNGDIAEIGVELTAPEGVTVIDGTDKHLAPGVIDTHSHMAIERGINEGTLSITADCDISDVINADDLTIYRALAGGVTTVQCLHGSANAIGGRSEVLKLRWKETADALRFPDAPQGIKFALGENPKRSNWGDRGVRFPATRMGVESVFQRAFRRAQEYRAELEAYEARRAAGEDPAPPRRDVRLDVLVGILEGNVGVHSHCYRADEILMLLRTAERFGFRIKTLQHVLEGYKVAAEIAAHGAGTSTFSDWWGYKLEAYDAIPQNAALLDEAGVVSTINSDSGELVRHLYVEAAKSMRYTDLGPVETLRLATLNSAIQLGIDDRVGSIEVGKDADLALLTAQPLSVYARVELTFVDGEIEFQRADVFGLDEGSVPAHEHARQPLVEASYDPDGGEAIAVTGGTLHPVSSDAIEAGTLLIQGGKIVDMGTDVAIPADARVIDAAGLHVWPGMIALNTDVGLREIGSVRGSVDDAEIGGNQPDVRVTASIHADSAHIDVTRTGGVTRTQTAPQQGGPLLGQSAVIRLAGDTWEELLVKDRDMLHIAFPRVRNDDEKKEVPEEIKELAELFDEAREYARLGKDAKEYGTRPPAFDPRLEALGPYLAGERQVALHVRSAQSILFALRFAQEEELNAVLFGAAEGWKVVDRIAASGLPVVVGPILATVRSRFDPYDSAYANAAVLHRAGVPIAIMADDSSNQRNLGIQAGMAVTFGLPYEEALRAVTLSPARLLGLDDRLGSLEIGKLADVVVTNGDLLEPATQVRHILIDGQLVDVKNRQTRLYERYHARLMTSQAK